MLVPLPLTDSSALISFLIFHISIFLSDSWSAISRRISAKRKYPQSLKKVLDAIYKRNLFPASKLVRSKIKLSRLLVPDYLRGKKEQRVNPNK
jgi:hypothetical protein